MAVYVTDRHVEDRLRAEREATGAERWDEVWEGVYFVPPLADNQHQSLGTRFAIALHGAIGPAEAEIYAGVNVSDREAGWTYNYRIPDVAVVLPGGSARDCGTHLCGGPDWLSEILSRGDRAREKLPFYSQLGVREALFIQRDPWSLELYQNEGGQLVLKGNSTPGDPTLLQSCVLPVSFRLVGGTSRPRIEVVHRDGSQRWLV